LAFLALALALAPAARAQSGPAQDTTHAAAQSFQQGSAAFARKDFRRAALLFETAYRLAPRAAAIYNAARAWESAGEPARAADAYAIGLSTSGKGGLQGAQAVDARGKVAELEKSLARVDVRAPPDAQVSIAHIERAAAPFSLHVKPGEHEVRATYAGGRVDARRISVVPGGHVGIDLTVAPIDAPPAGQGPQVPLAGPAAGGPTPPAVTAQPVAPPGQEYPPAPAGPVAQLVPPVAAPLPAAEPSPPAQPPPPPPVPGAKQRVIGFVVIGASAIGVITAAVLGESALQARDDFDSSGHTNPIIHDRAASLRLWTNVLWGVTAVTAGVGLYLVLSAPHANAPVKTDVELGAGRAAFNVRF
jgi:hypothetical protein